MRWRRPCNDSNGDGDSATSPLLGTFGFPTTLGDDSRTVFVGELGFGPGGASDEALGIPGVDVTRQSFTVEEDEIEAIE